MRTNFLFFYFAILTILMSCGSKTEQSVVEVEKPKSPEQLRMELKQLEENSPLEYVKCYGVTFEKVQKMTRQAGFFRDAEYAPDGALIKGVIKNSAAVAKFKDAIVRISFYSRTQTLIKEQSYAVYEFFSPTSTTNFSFKIADYPNEYETFKCDVVGATPVSKN